MVLLTKTAKRCKRKSCGSRAKFFMQISYKTKMTEQINPIPDLPNDRSAMGLIVTVISRQNVTRKLILFVA